MRRGWWSQRWNGFGPLRFESGIPMWLLVLLGVLLVFGCCCCVPAVKVLA